MLPKSNTSHQSSRDLKCRFSSKQLRMLLTSPHAMPSSPTNMYLILTSGRWMIPHSDSQIWYATNNPLHYRAPVFRSALKYLSFTIYILKVRVIISFFTHSNFLFMGAKWRELRYSIAAYGLPARRPCHLKTCLSRHQFFCSVTVMFLQDFTESKRINKMLA